MSDPIKVTADAKPNTYVVPMTGEISDGCRADVPAVECPFCSGQMSGAEYGAHHCSEVVKAGFKARVVKLLREIEYQGHEVVNQCPYCRNFGWHSPHCALAALLREAEAS